MTWKDRLQDASFRGVPFKVEEESAGTGRRVETHEYPNRDKPYTEDLGKITFRPSITAYVVGDDCFDQRDRLIDALNKPGPAAPPCQRCGLPITGIVTERTVRAVTPTNRIKRWRHDGTVADGER